MDAKLAGMIETSVELLASALFAGAVGFAGYTALGRVVVQPHLLVLTASLSTAAFFLSNFALGRRAAVRPTFSTPSFELPKFEPFETDELILTDQDRLAIDELVLAEADRYVPHSEPDALVLDDVLAEIDVDSRVVRLFDRKAMPTPGQLQSQIDHHLGHRNPGSPPHDASQALSEALAELRRSLR